MIESERSRLILFDLDDVFTYTDRHFLTAMRWALIKLRQCGGFEQERWQQVETAFWHQNMEAFKTAGVARERWQVILDSMVQDFPELSVSVQAAALAEFSQIYTAAPELRPSALAVINQVALLGHRLGILTHADEEATALKAETYGFAKWFDFVDSVPPLNSKNTQAWSECLVRAQTAVDQVIVVEDNRQNILAAIAAGVPAWQVIWHKGPECPQYGQQGATPDGVQVMTDLCRLPSIIQNIWP